MRFKRVLSSSQTGANRAALDFALRRGIDCEGWCPKGRTAEDGILDEKYPINETDSPGHLEGIKLNVENSDGTLIFTDGFPLGGRTAQVLQIAKENDKPNLVVDFQKDNIRSASKEILNWLEENRIETLNIAGPRESRKPGIYDFVREALDAIIKENRNRKLVEMMQLLGSFLTPSALIGLVANFWGASSQVSAGLSIWAILIIAIFLNRHAINKEIPSVAFLVVIIGGLPIVAYWGYESYKVGTQGFLAYYEKSKMIQGETIGKWIEEAEIEIWFCGTSFYSSGPQHLDLLKEKLVGGVDLKYLIYDFYSSNHKMMAANFGQSSEKFISECELGLHAVNDLIEFSEEDSVKGNVDVRFFSIISHYRLYAFDPDKDDKGSLLVVPYIPGKDSPSVPAYRFRNIETGIFHSFWEGTRSIWNDAKTLDEWKKRYQVEKVK